MKSLSKRKGKELVRLLAFRIFMAYNVFRLAAGGAFTHYRSFGKPHFNYTKKLSTEALHPRLRQTDVGGCVSFCRLLKLVF
jgi:hypothetical protein